MAEDSHFRNMLNNGRRTRRVETLSMSAASALESTGGASSGSKLKQLFFVFSITGLAFPGAASENRLCEELLEACGCNDWKMHGPTCPPACPGCSYPEGFHLRS